MAHRPSLPLLLSLLAGCGPTPPPPGVSIPAASAPSAAPRAASAAPRPAPAPSAPAGGQEETLWVDAQKVDCEGEGPRKCLRVRGPEEQEWRLFYGHIEGFTHEAGRTYRLRVQIERAPGAPADAAPRRYRLLEILPGTP